MEEQHKIYYKSPIGVLEIVSLVDCIIEINFISEDINKEEKRKEVPPILEEAYKQLDEYFKGERKEFDLKLSLQGTTFQKEVWKELMNIPYGQVATYKQVAVAIGNPKAVRAVGNANNKNKLPIVIPCHRVIGSNGKLVGYAGGLSVKQWLLNHEL